MISETGVLNGEIMRSDMLTKLLVYMLVHREYAVSIQELSEALWQEDETDNPAGALKNLMYRLRCTLKKVFGENEYIITSRGSYLWNQEISVVVDAEKFEEYCEAARNTKEEESIKLYEKAIELYQGDYMPHIVDKHWVVSQATYYHSLFLSATKSLAKLYLHRKKFEDMEHVCSKGIQYDSVDEQLYCDLITSLIEQNKHKLALERYEQAKKALKDVLGINNPKRLGEKYKEILEMSKGHTAENIKNVYDDIAEKQEPDGVFMCGFPVFKEIYRLEARKNYRMDEPEYIVLFSLDVKRNVDKSNEQVVSFLVNKAMNHMMCTLTEVLRIGDVAARYSDSQFVVLLPACSYESSLLVVNRILNQFYTRYKGNKIIVKTELEEVSTSKSLLVK